MIGAVLCCYHILLLKWFQNWPLGTPYVWLVSFWYVPVISWSKILLFDIVRCSRLILNYFAPALQSAISLRSSSSFYWRKGNRNQSLGTKCAYCYRDIKILSADNTGKYKYVHTHTHIYIFILKTTELILAFPETYL